MEQSIGNTQSPPRDCSKEFLLLARSIVETNYMDPDFNVEIFAQKLKISRMHLHRKLKANAGMSATGFIRMIRLEKAAELLLEKSINIAQITYRVGFNHLSYFSRCFKAQYGYNPSEYYHH